MKGSEVRAALSGQLLRYVRDEQPSVEDFIARFGGPGGCVYHVLRKGRALLEENGKLRLNPEHASPDGRQFTWETDVFLIDEDRILVVCRGPKPPLPRRTQPSVGP
jgi:hypothetical protein